MISATAETDLRVGGLAYAPLWGLDSALKPYPDLVREVPTVENGDVKLLERADLVCPPADREGVAEVLEAYLDSHT